MSGSETRKATVYTIVKSEVTHVRFARSEQRKSGIKRTLHQFNCWN